MVVLMVLVMVVMITVVVLSPNSKGVKCLVSCFTSEFSVFFVPLTLGILLG